MWFQSLVKARVECMLLLLINTRSLRWRLNDSRINSSFSGKQQRNDNLEVVFPDVQFFRLSPIISYFRTVGRSWIRPPVVRTYCRPDKILLTFIIYNIIPNVVLTRKAHNMLLPSASLSIKIWSTFLSEFKGFGPASYVLYLWFFMSFNFESCSLWDVQFLSDPGGGIPSKRI